MSRTGSARNLISGTHPLVPGSIPGPLVAALRLIRERSGLTQPQLGRLIDINPRVISTWENGHKRPSDENLIKWANALGYSLELSFTLVEKEMPRGIVPPQRER